MGDNSARYGKNKEDVTVCIRPYIFTLGIWDVLYKIGQPPTLWRQLTRIVIPISRQKIQQIQKKIPNQQLAYQDVHQDDPEPREQGQLDVCHHFP